jgi:hypothetical protein
VDGVPTCPPPPYHRAYRWHPLQPHEAATTRAEMEKRKQPCSSPPAAAEVGSINFLVSVAENTRDIHSLVLQPQAAVFIRGWMRPFQRLLYVPLRLCPRQRLDVTWRPY